MWRHLSLPAVGSARDERVIETCEEAARSTRDGMLDETTDRSAKDASADDVLRLCAVFRVKRPPVELIRFVAGPDGTVVPDLARRLPGRGVWVTAQRDAVMTAVRAKAFAKSLRRPVTAPDDLAELVERLMRRRLVEAVALANKAGLVTTGFTKIDARLAAGEVACLLHAREAAADGRDRLDRKFRAVQADRGAAAPIFDDLEIEELSLAIGRPNVVHAGLGTGGAADRAISEAGRLQRYRHSADDSLGSDARSLSTTRTDTA
jgi:predicted RNA-binding protein YlxR (DUF448 family)